MADGEGKGEIDSAACVSEKIGGPGAEHEAGELNKCKNIPYKCFRSPGFIG